MALKTTTVPTTAQENTGNPDGEVRLDSEGKGYWYSFIKNKPVEAPQKPVVTKIKRAKKAKDEQPKVEPTLEVVTLAVTETKQEPVEE